MLQPKNSCGASKYMRKPLRNWTKSSEMNRLLIKKTIQKQKMQSNKLTVIYILYHFGTWSKAVCICYFKIWENWLLPVEDTRNTAPNTYVLVWINGFKQVLQNRYHCCFKILQNLDKLWSLYQNWSVISHSEKMASQNDAKRMCPPLWVLMFHTYS